MDALTYADEAVIREVTNRFVPLRLPHDNPALTGRYAIKQTPTQLVLDREGAERHRMAGFLAPADELPALAVGLAKWLLADESRLGRRDEALATLAEALAMPKAEPQAEALFLEARLRFEAGGDAAILKSMAQRLAAEFPLTEWNARAAKYRLL